MSSCEFDFAPLLPPEPVLEPTPVELDEEALAREVAAAREAAFAEGFAAGRAEALAAAAPAADALTAGLHEAQELAATRAERLEADAVELALALAEKVVTAALAVRPELVVEAVRGALRGVIDRERVTLLVNPDDLDLVRDAIDGVVAALGGVEHCEVQAERRVARGGAVIRTSVGDVDAGADVKLGRAREIVEAALS